MSFLTWLGVLLLSLLWEFALEDWLGPVLIPGHGRESLVERWEYIVTAAIFAALALMGPTVLSLKIGRRREMAQQALEKSEKRFKDFAETAADWFWETDQDHRLRYLSERFREITGIATDQLLGMTVTEVVPGQIVEDEKFGWYVDRVRNHQPFETLEYQWMRPDGNTRVLSTCGSAWKNDPLIGGIGVQN